MKLGIKKSKFHHTDCLRRRICVTWWWKYPGAVRIALTCVCAPWLRQALCIPLAVSVLQLLRNECCICEKRLTGVCYKQGSATCFEGKFKEWKTFTASLTVVISSCTILLLSRMSPFVVQKQNYTKKWFHNICPLVHTMWNKHTNLTCNLHIHIHKMQRYWQLVGMQVRLRLGHWKIQNTKYSFLCLAVVDHHRRLVSNQFFLIVRGMSDLVF